MEPIYLDTHATTPVLPEVFSAMEPYLKQDFGNPASNHSFGWKAKKAVDTARDQVAKLCGAQSREIIFTSGATESNNLAIFGVAESYKSKGKHIISCNVEHKSVLEPLHELERRGFEVTLLACDKFGQVSSKQLREALRPDTILVTIQLANNEVGTLQPIAEMAQVLKGRDLIFHTDAVQAGATQDLDVNKLGVDLMSLSGHKMYGPKGIGALYVRAKNPRLKLFPHMFGSGQETGLRSGTLNVPGIVGLGKACEMAFQDRAKNFEKLKFMRDKLESELTKISGNKVNGHPTERLPHNLSITLENIVSTAEFLKVNPEICVSVGAACSVNLIQPSHVMTAIGLRDEEANRTLRIGLSLKTTTEELERATKALAGT